MAALVVGAYGCEPDRLDLPVGPVPVSEIETRSVEWTDTARPTAANATWEGAPARTLRTRLWFAVEPPQGSPACQRSRCRLIVLAHGLGGAPEGLSLLALSLATHGYIVAAPAFPLTNAGALGGYETGLGDVVEEPADLAFVIDAVLSAGRTAGDPLDGRIAAPPVGVVGHSLGGSAAIALTRLECCRDERVGAVALIAPSIKNVGRFGQGISGRGLATLLVHGTADEVVPLVESRSLYAALPPPRTLVELSRAGHSDLVEDVGERSPYLGATVQAIVAFFEASLGSRPEATEAVFQKIRDLGHTVHDHPG